MRLVYVIGAPGSGKSTAVRRLLERMDPGIRDSPVPHVRWYEGDSEEPVCVTLEKLRPGFSGTDSLAMSIQPKAIAWLSGKPTARVLAEGDRLGNAKFFEAMKAAGVDLRVVWLDTPPELAAERRAARGGGQNEAWVKGRETKVKNLVGWATERLDGTGTPAYLAEELREVLLA